MILDKRLFENDKIQNLFETLILSRSYFGYENQNKQMEKEIEHILNRSESIELKNGAEKPFLKRIYELELKLLEEKDSPQTKNNLEEIHANYLRFLDDLPLELLSVKEDLELYTKQVYNRLGYKVENAEYKKTILNENSKVKEVIASKSLDNLISQNIGFFQLVDSSVNLKQDRRIKAQKSIMADENKDEKEEIKVKEEKPVLNRKTVIKEEVVKISERPLNKESEIEELEKPHFEEEKISLPIDDDEDFTNTIFDSFSPISEDDGEVKLDNTISLDLNNINDRDKDKEPKIAAKENKSEKTEDLDEIENIDDIDTFEMEMYENFSLEEVSSVMYGDSKYWKEIYKANLKTLNEVVKAKKGGDYTGIEKDSNVFTGLILKVPTSIEK